MNYKQIFLFLSFSLIISACDGKKRTNKDGETSDVEKTIVVQMHAKSKSSATGTATFTEKDGVVRMEFKGSGFNPGKHAIHLHEFANCSAADGTSTGGHWNPSDEAHGKWGTSPYHKGDIGNFVADADGNVDFAFETDEWCLTCDDEAKNIIGKSLIIHDQPDDFVTQPTGNAGGRICCGEILE